VSALIQHYTAEQVHAALEYPVLIERLRQAFAQGASVPLRHAHKVNEHENARLLLMPAWREGEALGVKIVTAFPGNAARGAATVAATYVLLDGSTGHPLALIDGEALTLRRTAAASALASSFLSRPDSRTLLVVGTGKLAPYMASAHAACRQFRRSWCGDASPTRPPRFPRAAAAGIAIAATDLARRQLAEADVVTCATYAVTAGSCTAPTSAQGTPFDLVGGFTPTMREADDELVAKASVFVDTYTGRSGRRRRRRRANPIGCPEAADVRAELAELCRGEKKGRTGAAEITLFKSVGTALEDLTAAQMVHQAARRGG
jgi:ornithine cyclodeaminase